MSRRPNGRRLICVYGRLSSEMYVAAAGACAREERSPLAPMRPAAAHRRRGMMYGPHLFTVGGDPKPWGNQSGRADERDRAPGVDMRVLIGETTMEVSDEQAEVLLVFVNLSLLLLASYAQPRAGEPDAAT